MTKKYIMYVIRWQLSTPILAVVLILLSNMNEWVATIIANFIGALIFFWVDKIIFKTIVKKPIWEIEENGTCTDCGAKGKTYRVVEWFNYNRINDKTPEFRCEKCKDIKLLQVSNNIKPIKKT